MTRSLDTDDVFDALHEAIGHIRNAPNYRPHKLALDDVPMLADLIRIVLEERGCVISDQTAAA